MEITSDGNKQSSNQAPFAPPLPGSGVVDTMGLFGTVTSLLPFDTTADGLNKKTCDSSPDLSGAVLVQHRDHQLALPAAVFQARENNSFGVPFSFADLIASSEDANKLHIPLVREEVTVEKQVVDTGRGLRISKTVIETPHVMEQSLQQDHLTVAHVPQGRFVEPDAIPSTRYEGTTMIIPIIEEVLVVQTQLRLKEEIHITRESRTVTAKETVHLKSDQIRVERFDESSDQQGRRQVGNAESIESGQ